MRRASKPEDKERTKLIEAKFAKHDYRNQMLLVYLILGMIEAVPLEEMAARQNNAESMAPLMDPTLWIEKGKQFSEDKEATAILLEAKLKFLQFKERVKL